MYDYISDSCDEYDDYYDEDFEYTTANPYDIQYDYQQVKIEETPLEKLKRSIRENNLELLKEVISSMIEITKPDEFKCNGNTLNESGDRESDEENYIEDVYSESSFMETKPKSYKSFTKEILFDNGETPLMYAASLRNFEVMSHLISCGYNVNYQQKNTMKTATVALCMSTESLWLETRENWLDESRKCLRLLLDNMADVCVKCFICSEEYGNQALHYAVLNNNWQLLEILLHTNLDIDSMNQQCKSALMLAAGKGLVTCCQMLLDNGANALTKDKSNQTASEIAEVNGYRHLADTLQLFSGQAQHNIRLYSIWQQFNNCQNQNIYDHSIQPEIFSHNLNSYNMSCIESFCLSIDAPYLIDLMKSQGLTIADLKTMPQNTLVEMGIPLNDCMKIAATTADLHKLSGNSSQKRSVPPTSCTEYGRSIKPIVLLEMMGNIHEHFELIDNLTDGLLYHMDKNQNYYREKYQIVNKATIATMKTNLSSCDDNVAIISKSNKEINITLSCKLSSQENSIIDSLDEVNDADNLDKDTQEAYKRLQELHRNKLGSRIKKLALCISAVALGSIVIRRAWIFSK